MPILVHAEIHGLAGRAAELRDLLVAHAAETAAAPGSHGATALAVVGGDPGEYVLDAWWDDEASLRAHYAGAGYARYATAVGELLARPSDVAIHYVERTVHPQGDASLDPTRLG